MSQTEKAGKERQQLPILEMRVELKGNHQRKIVKTPMNIVGL